MPTLPGQEHFKGKIWHSSQLDGKSAKGKKIAIIGGGASAVEALEFVASEEAEHTNVLARSEKWIIPRNPLVGHPTRHEHLGKRNDLFLDPRVHSLSLLLPRPLRYLPRP
jgi:cation diffusion facilitator CzcD-associated flavoprotein CzcO